MRKEHEITETKTSFTELMEYVQTTRVDYEKKNQKAPDVGQKIKRSEVSV